MSGWCWLGMYAGLILTVFWVGHRLEQITPHVHGPRVRTFDEHWEDNRIVLSGSYDPIAEAEAVTREAAS